MTEIRFIPNKELSNISSKGNGFSKLEHAESVAKARSGNELIAKKGELYYLYETNDKTNLSDFVNYEKVKILEFVNEENEIINIQSKDGIKGVKGKVADKELEGKASKGNNFRNYTHAESVAKHLDFPTAIVEKNRHYYIYSITNESADKLINGDNSLLDAKITSVVKNGKPHYNFGFESQSEIPNNEIAFSKNGKIFIKDKEFKLSGINVYDLAFVASRSQEELEKTLKTIASSGANTVRFWAFSIHKPEVFNNIFDTSKKLNLDLKFIPVFGNHWQDMESPSSKFRKTDEWYKNDFKKEYLPHVLETVESLVEKDNVLMIELMNEPEGNHNTLRNFADEVSTKVRKIYSDYEKEHNKEIPRHLISLGTIGGPQRNGMIGSEYKELFGLPNIDVITSHDYDFDHGRAGEDSISNDYLDNIKYAKELNKPYFLGEIGVKVRENGSENKPNGKELRDSTEALRIIKERISVYKDQDISGVLVWGPQPRGHAVDGGGFGFSFEKGDKNESHLKSVFDIFNK